MLRINESVVGNCLGKLTLQYKYTRPDILMSKIATYKINFSVVVIIDGYFSLYKVSHFCFDYGNKSQ